MKYEISGGVEAYPITDLLSDRVKFKLVAAEQHLNKLKDMHNEYGNIAGDRKIFAEIEIDCFLAQIIGAKDSLRVQINKELKLGLIDDEIKEKIKLELKKKTNNI